MNLTPEHLRIINAGLLKFPAELRHEVAEFLFAGLAKLDSVTEAAVHSRIGVALHHFEQRSREALTIQDVMKTSPVERQRRGALIAARSQRKTELAKFKAAKPHPTLKRWRWPEKPIEIIG